jgi:hypothetical protein
MGEMALGEMGIHPKNSSVNEFVLEHINWKYCINLSSLMNYTTFFTLFHEQIPTG